MNNRKINSNSNRRMVSSGLLRRVALVRTDVSEELCASFIRVTKIGELGTTQAATSNRRTLRRNTILHSHRRGNLKSYTVTVTIWHFRWEWPGWIPAGVPPKRRFLQEPHSVTSQKTPFFIFTAVKTSNLTYYSISQKDYSLLSTDPKLPASP
jgi:hypothetical protein